MKLISHSILFTLHRNSFIYISFNQGHTHTQMLNELFTTDTGPKLECISGLVTSPKET